MGFLSELLAQVKRSLPVLALLLIIAYVDLVVAVRDSSAGSKEQQARGLSRRAPEYAAQLSALMMMRQNRSGTLRRVRSAASQSPRPRAAALAPAPEDKAFAAARAAVPSRPPARRVGGVIVAPPPVSLPGPCYDSLGLNRSRDAACYFESEALFNAELDADEHGPFCWGHSGWDYRPPPHAPLLFHAVVVDMRGSMGQFADLLVNSFLATQCCDATLWLWADAGSVDALTLAVEASSELHAGRVEIKRLNLGSEWDAVAPDFAAAGVNASKVAVLAEVRRRGNTAILYSF